MRRAALALAACVLVVPCALAATGYWTGKQEMVQTVTYQMAWKCEYNVNGQMVYLIFKNRCPSSVEVE